jgi:hypothetical protein
VTFPRPQSTRDRPQPGSDIRAGVTSPPRVNNRAAHGAQGREGTELTIFTGRKERREKKNRETLAPGFVVRAWAEMRNPSAGFHPLGRWAAGRGRWGGLRTERTRERREPENPNPNPSAEPEP